MIDNNLHVNLLASLDPSQLMNDDECNDHPGDVQVGMYLLKLAVEQFMLLNYVVELFMFLFKFVCDEKSQLWTIISFKCDSYVLVIVCVVLENQEVLMG